jgi:hypothetical protein
VLVFSVITTEELLAFAELIIESSSVGENIKNISFILIALLKEFGSIELSKKD